MNPDDVNFDKFYIDYNKYQNEVVEKNNLSKLDYIQKIMNELIKKQKTYTLDQLRNIDVSSSLSDDVMAKLKLLYGDFIVIPVDKL